MGSEYQCEWLHINGSKERDVLDDTIAMRTLTKKLLNSGIEMDSDDVLDDICYKYA